MQGLYDFVTSGLKARKDDWEAAAAHAGVHKKTVERIATGTVPNPGVRTMEALAEWLRQNRRRPTRQPAQ